MSDAMLVTGTSGFIGRAFLKRAVASELVSPMMIGVRRHSRRTDVREELLDLAADEIVLPSGIETVIHLAGEKSDSTQMTRVNFEAARGLADAAAKAGAKNFIHLSSVGVYGAGHRAGEVIELTAHRPCNLYERTKDAGEAAVRESCHRHGLRCVVLQPTNVIGLTGGSQRPLLGLIRAICRGRYRHIGEGDGWVNYVAVEDVAAAISFAATNASVSGTYIVNSPTRIRHLVSTIANRLGVSTPAAGIPRWTGALAGVAAGWASKLLGRDLPFSRERFLEMINTTVYSNAAYLQTGFVYPVGIDAALTALADAYQAEGLL